MIIIPEIAPIIATSTVGSEGILCNNEYRCEEYKDRLRSEEHYLDVETVFSLVVAGGHHAALVIHLVHLALQDLLVVLLVCCVPDPLLLVPTISVISGALSLQDFKPITELPILELDEVVIEEPLDLWLGQTLFGSAGDLRHVRLEHLGTGTGASEPGLHSMVHGG